MPLYDLACSSCDKTRPDYYTARFDDPSPACHACGAPTVRLWMTHAPNVHGDEIDISIKHGLCLPDGTPRRFRSKTELARAAKAAGLTNHVEHIGAPGSDKSKFTTRWV